MMAGQSGVTMHELLCEKGLDQTQLNIKCTDEHLQCISRFLGGWREVLPYLGLKDTVREEIETNHKRERERGLMMLQKWKQKYAFKATYRKLVEILLEIERADDAEKICDLFKESSLSSKNPAELRSSGSELAEPDTSHCESASSTPSIRNADLPSEAVLPTGSSNPPDQPGITPSRKRKLVTDSTVKCEQCGKPALLLRTKTDTNNNQGRQFYKCEHCDTFIKWAQEKRRRYDAVCKCGLPAAERTVVKDGPNKGKLCYFCPKPREEQCGYIELAENIPIAKRQRLCGKCRMPGHTRKNCPR